MTLPPTARPGRRARGGGRGRSRAGPPDVLSAPPEGRHAPFAFPIGTRFWTAGLCRRVAAQRPFLTVLDRAVDVLFGMPPRGAGAPAITPQVSRTPNWPRSWANFSPLYLCFPPECMGQLASFGPDRHLPSPQESITGHKPAMLRFNELLLDAGAHRVIIIRLSL